MAIKVETTSECRLVIASEPQEMDMRNFPEEEESTSHEYSGNKYQVNDSICFLKTQNNTFVIGICRQ